MAEASHPQRKHPRLDPSAYADPNAVCSIAIATRDRQAVFADPTLAEIAIAILHDHSAKTGVRLYAYCLMPDHAHLVLSSSAACTITTFVGQYKNLVTRASWTLGYSGTLWQESFCDHFLRREETLAAVVDYILANPVRRGMVKDWREYPFSGTLASPWV